MIQEVKSYNAKCYGCGKVLTIDRPFSSIESMMNTLRRDGWKVVKPVYPDMQTETCCPDCIKEIEKPKDSKPMRGGFAEEPYEGYEAGLLYARTGTDTVPPIPTFNEECKGCGKRFSEVSYESKEQLRVAMMLTGWIQLPSIDDSAYCYCPDCITNPKPI